VKTQLPFVCFAATLLAFCAVVSAQPGQQSLRWTNPLVEQRADPHVTVHEGKYLMIATVPQYDRIELRRAATLDSLRDAEPKVLWRRHESGPMGAHIWAPELHRIDGKWYIYFAAGSAEKKWDIRIYVLENSAEDPFAGEWIEKGQLKTQFETFSLDATMFEHRGVRYLVWTDRDPAIKGTNIYIAKMDTPWSLTGPQVRLSKPELPWEQIGHWVNEGPAVLVRNGRVFMTYSASATDANYCLGLLAADEDADLLDPKSWTKSQSPVFATNDATGQFGPGHNSFTTSLDGKTDINVYHARNYREIVGDPLKNHDRHTRAQIVRWRADGTPDFGVPVPDGPYAPEGERPVVGKLTANAVPRGKVAAKPLFRDPVYDGAADPVVIWNRAEKKWFMFYTNRRANVPELDGVTWVHGTKLGIAESTDGGASWTYRDTANIPHGGADMTHWAPEIVEAGGIYHMYLTFVPGIFADWKHPRDILHLTSKNLIDWEYRSTLKLASDRVIDACVLPLPEGGWRMWYNNERDRKSIYYADSPDLENWTDKGKAVGDQGGEGPKVFRWRGAYWMITDVWKGLAVYRSDDLASWKRQGGGNLLEHPGKGEDDGVIGGHPDVVISGDRAYLFYFTHPERIPGKVRTDGPGQRRSSLQVVELLEKDGILSCDRDVPTHVELISINPNK
jgi:GH43 family beta-xylosidase